MAKEIENRNGASSVSIEMVALAMMSSAYIVKKTDDNGIVFWNVKESRFRW